MKIIHKVKIMLYEFIKLTYNISNHQYIFTEASKFLKSRVKVTQTWETRKIDLRYVASLQHDAKSFQSRGHTGLDLLTSKIVKITTCEEGLR